MSARDLVVFVEPAFGELTPGIQKKLAQELETIFTVDARRAKAITVSRSFTGYASDVEKSVVLGVGVQFEDGFESHIVKIGKREQVEPDATGWKTCTAGRDVSSRILHPVRDYPLPHGRCAVLYRDAYMLLGGYGSKARVESLETAAEWAVKDDRPDPRSVERSIAQIYTDLGRWFYQHAQADRERALTFYETKLRARHPLEETRVLVLWTRPGGDARPDPVGLRRDAIWLLCGRERPTDLDQTVAPYLDPVDYVRWALESGMVPETLIGRSHGDLHGGNVLVGVERGEAQYPTVIDYGKMGPDNVLAWDFAMLETELKARLLPQLYRDPEAREPLLKKSPRKRTPEKADADDVSDQARRADRLEFAYLFEKLVAERSARIQGRDDAERLAPPGERTVTLVRKLDRLLGIVLRVRQEAALALGFQRGRQFAWRDEYYFALAVYGLLGVKWDYEPRALECALISAGVAAAGITAGQKVMHDAMQQSASESTTSPSYRVPLYLAHRYWQHGKAKEGLEVLNRHGQQFSHAVPLEQERAQLLLELGQVYQAQKLTRALRDGCRVFGDHETLSRMGRTYKNAGDRSWAREYTAEAGALGPMAGSPAWQQYQMALDVYEEAFNLSNHYYPGVNAASLALLLQETTKAQRLAQRVAKSCADPAAVATEDLFWLFATEGEAALIEGKYSEARKFYHDALAEPTAEIGHVQAAYHQICRLWHVLDKSEANRLVDDLFANHATWPAVQPGPVGGCGGRK
jgi:tetratricopeptide (TPR) repeat protein